MLTTSLIAGIKHANSENISGPKRRSATCSKGKDSAVDSTPTAIQHKQNPTTLPTSSNLGRAD